MTSLMQHELDNIWDQKPNPVFVDRITFSREKVGDIHKSKNIMVKPIDSSFSTETIFDDTSIKCVIIYIYIKYI